MKLRDQLWPNLQSVGVLCKDSKDARVSLYGLSGSGLAIGILLLIGLTSCNVLPGEKPPIDTPPAATAESRESPTAMENRNWVIITKERAVELGIASWLLESDGFWTPSVDDIEKLEGEITEYLSQNPDEFYRQPPVWQRFDEYQRQYIGLERGGRQIIYGNYFCNSGSVNWRQDLVVVEDGGDCFFQVEYDVESGLFIKLLVNGES